MSKGLDALFGDDVGQGVEMIPISDLKAFPNHPFKVIEDNEDMEMLIQSVVERGILEPLKVMPSPGGGFYIISGHRRRHAGKASGFSELPCIVEEVSLEDATQEMVDANLHREVILPSEKAFAYKMKMDASRHQGRAGGRTSAEEIGEATGDSARTIQRYIRLTHLSEDLLELVDNKKISVGNGVLLSYLTSDNQGTLMAFYEEMKKLPNTDQCERLKELGSDKNLTWDDVEEIILGNKEKKPAQKAVKLEASWLEEFFSKEELVDVDFIRSTIRGLLEEWQSGR